jgi:hypothetical protein
MKAETDSFLTLAPHDDEERDIILRSICPGKGTSLSVSFGFEAGLPIMPFWI